MNQESVKCQKIFSNTNIDKISWHFWTHFLTFLRIGQFYDIIGSIFWHFHSRVNFLTFQRPFLASESVYWHFFALVNFLTHYLTCFDYERTRHLGLISWHFYTSFSFLTFLCPQIKINVDNFKNFLTFSEYSPFNPDPELQSELL